MEDPWSDVFVVPCHPFTCALVDHHPDHGVAVALDHGLREPALLPDVSELVAEQPASIAGLGPVLTAGEHEVLAKGEGPENYFVILGCSGWGPGQVEQEITENAWFSCPANKEIIFSTEFDNKPKLVAASLGFDLSQLSSDHGSC